jgi:hypothetical protein
MSDSNIMLLVVSPVIDSLIEAISLQRVVAFNLKLQLGGDIKTLPEYSQIMEIASELFTENGKMHDATKDAFCQVLAQKL